MFLENLIAKFGKDLIDVIRAIPARDNSGTFAFATEIAAIESVRVPGMDLVTFARRHFGTGTLRKVGEGMYAVLRTVKATPAPASKPAHTVPHYAYHVV